MAASRRILVVAGAAVAVALIACTGILGIDNYKEVPCRFDGGCDDAALDVPVDTYDAGLTSDDASDAPADIAVMDVVITPDSPSFFWARWKMPNPADASSAPGLDAAIEGGQDCAPPLLPNAMSYDASPEAGDAGIDTVFDNVTQLTWQRDGSGQLTSAQAASAYCDALGPGKWRMPTRIELVSLIDFTRSPAIDPVFSNTQLDTYWSSSAGQSSGQYWVVSFTDGTVTPGTGRYVRCVQVSP
jgi:hypothetical protein